MRLRGALLVTLLLAALAIAGCGGGGDDDSTETTAPATATTAALSKAEFIEQGDAICAEVNSAVGAVGSAETDVKGQTIQVSDLYVGMVDSLQRLGMPSDSSGYSEFMEAAEKLAKVEGEVKLAAEREDTAALGEAASAATPALEGFQSQAGVYGFTECDEGPHAPTAAAGTGAGAGTGEEGGVEAAPEGSPEAIEEEVAPEATEEAAPETGGAEGGAAPAGGGTGAGGGGGEAGGSSGGIGPG